MQGRGQLEDAPFLLVDSFKESTFKFKLNIPSPSFAVAIMVIIA